MAGIAPAATAYRIDSYPRVLQQSKVSACTSCRKIQICSQPSQLPSLAPRSLSSVPTYGHPSRAPHGSRRRVACASNPASSTYDPHISREVQLAKDDLLGAIASSERGLDSGAHKKKAIMAAIEVLQKAGTGKTTTSEALSATWRLLWTTEKETLFIFQKASWFGTEAGDAFQPIDVEQKTLGNVITFPPAGAFSVKAEIEVASPQRISFRFLSAELKTPTRKIQLPPVGKGWFDNLYLDKDIRISFDSRGDYLVTERATFIWQD